MKFNCLDGFVSVFEDCFIEEEKYDWRIYLVLGILEKRYVEIDILRELREIMGNWSK